MSRREKAIGTLRAVLDGRRLIWFGIRGEDGEALLQLPELDASYSIIAPLRSGRIPAAANVALEDITGVRPDLDRFDIDLETNDHAADFRRRLLRELSGRCVLVTYRPSAVVSALAFSMADTMTLAGPWKDRQAAFEHKPWVERSLAAIGVRGLDWQYVSDEHRSRAKRLLAGGPLILRASRTSGGVGIVRVSTEEEVDDHWPAQPDAFVAVAPFLEPTVPVNLSGCVFADGSIRLHPPSVQLIGIPSCTDRSFGYCGNDFTAIGGLADAVLREMDEMGRSVGAWLFQERYVGAFGVDVLVYEDRVHFVEINPRFQGSSAASAEIAAALEVPDLFLDHLAATLGCPAPGPGLTLVDWAHRQPPVSQVVLHNTSPRPLARGPAPLPPRVGGTQFAQVAADGVAIQPGGAICRVSQPRSVTSTGFELDDPTERLVRAVHAAFVSA